MRISQIALFMVCLAAAAAMLQGSGFYDEVGAGSPDPGIKESTDDAAGAAPGEAATNFGNQVIGGISTFIMSAVSNVISALSPALNLGDAAGNLGAPDWASSYVAAPIGIMFSLAVIYFLTGRRRI